MQIGTAVCFILNIWTFVETVELLCGECLKLKRDCIFLYLSVLVEVKKSIFVGTWIIFPHIWKVRGVTNEVLNIICFSMEINAMTICPRDKQIFLLSEVIILQKQHILRFLDSAAVVWTWTLWNGLTLRKKNQIFCQMQSLQESDWINDCYINAFYMINWARNITVSYLKGRNIVSRIPPTKWTHNGEKMSACVLSLELLKNSDEMLCWVPKLNFWNRFNFSLCQKGKPCLRAETECYQFSHKCPTAKHVYII